jgi:hypothetical protein
MQKTIQKYLIQLKMPISPLTIKVQQKREIGGSVHHLSLPQAFPSLTRMAFFWPILPCPNSVEIARLLMAIAG